MICHFSVQFRNKLPLISVGVWLSLITGGSMVLIDHAARPGKTLTPLTCWPAGTQMARDQERPTLIMFAHPRCPCTRASLGRLSKIANDCADQVDIQVVFYCPRSENGDWRTTDLVTQAQQIPSAKIGFDCDAVEAQRFRATVSGQVLLFGTSGELLYDGGITASRGHAGDNFGESTVVAMLCAPGNPPGGAIKARSFPTFGCALISGEPLNENRTR